MDDITTCYERGGQPEWDNNDYQRDFVWLGIRRDKMPRYEPTEKMKEQIKNNFTYHPPKDDQQARYVSIRDMARELATFIIENTSPSREQSLALTELETSIFWANAAIARNE